MKMIVTELKSKLLVLNPLLIALAMMLSSCGFIEEKNGKLLFFDRGGGGGGPVYLHEIFCNSGYGEMAEAIAKGDYDRFSSLYDDSQFVDSEGRFGITLLWLAVKFQQDEIVEFLLDRGASPDVEIDWVSSTIGLAAEGDSAILRRILAAGASIDNESGGIYRLLPVHHAAENNRIENMKMLLAAGADVNSRTESGLFPLNLALGSRSMKMLWFLLEEGADPAMTNNNGTTIVNSMNRYTFNKEDSEAVAQILEWLTAHGYDINELAKNKMREGK